jgi:histone-lysine N-methyltransferase SETMAR
MDNPTPHRVKLTKSCFKTLRLREVAHPPYSPDLASSDFYLFGKLKEQMAGSEFESAEDFLGMIRWLANSILREELESVFQEWERRLEEGIRNGGDDVS